VQLICTVPDGEPVAPVVLELEDGSDRIVGIEDATQWGLQVPQLLRAATGSGSRSDTVPAA
jgi:hypothetical protein